MIPWGTGYPLSWVPIRPVSARVSCVPRERVQSVSRRRKLVTRRRLVYVCSSRERGTRAMHVKSSGVMGCLALYAYGCALTVLGDLFIRDQRHPVEAS